MPGIHLTTPGLRAPSQSCVTFPTNLPRQGTATKVTAGRESPKPEGIRFGAHSAQVVYMARNPKDVLVSFYHFQRIANFLPDPSSFQDFMDEFLEGTGGFQGLKVVSRAPTSCHQAGGAAFMFWPLKRIPCFSGALPSMFPISFFPSLLRLLV
jgi:hypothetical protein